jgi:hypothetical protein
MNVSSQKLGIPSVSVKVESQWLPLAFLLPSHPVCPQTDLSEGQGVFRRATTRERSSSPSLFRTLVQRWVEVLERFGQLRVVRELRVVQGFFVQCLVLIGRRVE